MFYIHVFLHIFLHSTFLPILMFSLSLNSFLHFLPPPPTPPPYPFPLHLTTLFIFSLSLPSSYNPKTFIPSYFHILFSLHLVQPFVRPFFVPSFSSCVLYLTILFILGTTRSFNQIFISHLLDQSVIFFSREPRFLLENMDLILKQLLAKESVDFHIGWLVV